MHTRDIFPSFLSFGIPQKGVGSICVQLHVVCAVNYPIRCSFRAYLVKALDATLATVGFGVFALLPNRPSCDHSNFDATPKTRLFKLCVLILDIMAVSQIYLLGRSSYFMLFSKSFLHIMYKIFSAFCYKKNKPRHK